MDKTRPRKNIRIVLAILALIPIGLLGQHLIFDYHVYTGDSIQELVFLILGLRLALIRLAKQYGRYGYRKVGGLLQAEGWRINHKKVERLWREEAAASPAAQEA